MVAAAAFCLLLLVAASSAVPLSSPGQQVVVRSTVTVSDELHAFVASGEALPLTKVAGATAVASSQRRLQSGGGTLVTIDYTVLCQSDCDSIVAQMALLVDDEAVGRAHAESLISAISAAAADAGFADAVLSSAEDVMLTIAAPEIVTLAIPPLTPEPAPAPAPEPVEPAPEPAPEPLSLTDCTGVEDGTACDDENPLTDVSICHAQVCETITYTRSDLSQCAAFILPLDTSLVTLELAEAACAANPDCGGVSDLYCNGMYPGAVDHYALCLGSDTVYDVSTCVFLAPEPEPVEYATTSVDTVAGSPDGFVTYALTATLSDATSNVYSIFGNSATPLSIPAAYQVATPFGVDTGGVSPLFYASVPESQYDSWLTVGVTDGSAGVGIASTGIDFASWTESAGLTADNGAVFFMDPDSGPSGSAVVAQLTVAVGTSTTVTMGLQGRRAGSSPNDDLDDWQQAVSFSL
jgi:hypothetical protein